MMAETPTKIGIVSKHAHCKSHITALAKDGFDVVALGGSPTNIPPSIDVVVVRTESCGHGGSDTALEWSRKTGKRVIMENGLSGIRRALKEDPQLQKYTRAAEILLRDRPEDTAEQVRDTLVAMGADLQTATKVVESIDALNSTTAEPEEGTMFPHPYPEPTEGTWAALVPESRARTQAQIGRQVYDGLRPEVRQTIRDIFMSRMAGEGPYFLPSSDNTFKGRKWKAFRDLRGKPHQFSTVLLLCLPSDEPYCRKPLHRAYQTYSGKRTDGRVVEAAAWATGHTILLEKKWPKAETPDQQETPKVEVGKVPEEFLEKLRSPEPAAADFTGQLKNLQNQMEEQVLDLMSQMDKVKRENETLRAEVKDLRAEVSTLRDLVATYESDPTEDLPPEDTALRALGDLKEALDGLREKGAEVSLKIKL